ncbi:MAG: tetratricopeptide repeat protein [Anaerolineales bacterium]|nr:tetratricopeptide repeat protein [Anaerolineales bacterium]
MADNAFVKIGTALLKHQVKKLVGDETLEVIGEELADIGGDKLDAWLGERSTQEEIEKAAQSAQSCFREKVTDNDLQQWMVSLPLGNLPKVVEAIDELPSSPNESKLENTLRESIALSWKKLSPEQMDNAIHAFMSCLRSALLPIEKQTLMVIGRSVLRIEEKINQLTRLVEQLKPYSTEIQGESRFGSINVGGNVERSVVIAGNNNVVNYYAAVEANVEKHEPDYWALKHPYPMPPNFTGRIVERATLTHWLKEDSENRLFILRALGGFGKSALSWHWLTHDVDSREWKKVLWWSFYEGDASFEHFIEETLKYLKLEVPQGGRPQVDELLKAMQSQKILLIMDGFERALRAYSSMNAAYQGDEAESPSPAGRGVRGEGENNQLDCVNINAEFFLRGICSLPNIQSKVLMTTRLTPRAVKPRGEFMLGCREVELTSMQPADAVEFFRKQKIKGTHAEIEAACAPYGYHPLSLRILARYIVRDFHNPRNIVVAQTLKIDGDIKAQKHHVMEVAYNSLTEQAQKLLSTIACFRSSVEFKALETIVESKDTLDSDLHDLVDSGLLNFDQKSKKFDLHPIVRRYAYDCLTAPDRTATHNHLREYFATVDVPEQIKSLNDLLPIIELYYHTVMAGSFDEARQLFQDRLRNTLHYHLMFNQVQIELLQLLFTDRKNELLNLNNEDAKAWTLNQLAVAYALSGQPSQAIPLWRQQLSIREKQGMKKGLAIGLGGLASVVLLPIGALVEAERNLYRSIELSHEIESEYDEAVNRQELGHLLSYRGKWNEAEAELSTSQRLAERTLHIQTQSITWAYRALRFLQIARSSQYENQDLVGMFVQMAIGAANRSLKLADETANSIYSYESDFIRTHWLLGAIHRMNNESQLSEKHLDEALLRCRNSNLVNFEANILLDLARLRYEQKNYEEAKSLADEALLITERCGYVLQGADVNLFLAELTLTLDPSPEGRGKARGYAEEALKLATCDGPPYYYKVAYEEAERFLAKLQG